MNNNIRSIWFIVVLFASSIIIITGCADTGLVVDSRDNSIEEKSSGNATGNKYFSKSLALMAIVEKQTKPLFKIATKMPPVKKGEWRDFWNEPEQSPQKYVLSMPSIVTDKLTTLYVQPIGQFNAADKVILQKTVDFLRANFQTPVEVLSYQSNNFPQKAFKYNKNNDLQLNSVYITDELLKREMPEDAWGILAITPDDIYRAEGLDRHYGDSLRYGRRGVISMYYLRSSNKAEELSLILKGASHEATHLLSLPHCGRYRCNMNGRIKLEEFRAAPLYYSPECLSKLLFGTSANINKRFGELIAFCKKNNLREELDYYNQALKITGSK